MSTRLHIVVSEGLVARIDAARGPGQPRADFIRRAVERALENGAARELPSPAPAEQPEMDGVPFTDLSDRLRETRPRVSPPKPVSPRVPFRRDVKPFQRGDK